MHQGTTMLATSKNVLFPANHRYWWPNTLIITLASTLATAIVSSHQYQWLAGGYDLEMAWLVHSV